jgi:preprotein translocase subunit SecF
VVGLRRLFGEFDFYGARRLFYVISLVVIIAGLVSIALPNFGLRLGIDFSGGSLLEAKFERTDVTTSEIRAALAPLDLGEPIIQQSADEPGRFLIRTKAFDETQRQSVEDTLATTVGEFQVLRFEGISPVIGQELSSKSLLAVGIASVLMLVYITVRFEFRFAVAGIIALLHDVAVTVAFFSLLGREINGPFVAALLTVVGYSINDTIVIFDRIRENLRAKAHGPGDFAPLINRSLAETMPRSINTSVTTLLAILAVFIFGGRTTRDFALALIIGVVAGTYSSIFIASPIWATWREATLRTAARSRAGDQSRSSGRGRTPAGPQAAEGPLRAESGQGAPQAGRERPAQPGAQTEERRVPGGGVRASSSRPAQAPRTAGVARPASGGARKSRRKRKRR